MVRDRTSFVSVACRPGVRIRHDAPGLDDVDLNHAALINRTRVASVDHQMSESARHPFALPGILA